MNYQTKAFHVSFVIHTLLIFGALGLGHSPVRYGKPLVIDFTLEHAADTRIGVRQETAVPEKQAIAPRHRADTASRPAKESREVPISAPVPEDRITGTAPPAPAAAATESNSLSGTAEIARPGSPAAGKNESGGAGAHGQTATGSPVRARSDAGGPEGGAAAQYLTEHFSYIKELVQRNVAYPNMARKMGWEGKTVIAFTILADGNARDVRIKERCGIEMLDKNAVEAVKKASPFPRPPAEAQIVLPIVYRLN
jgi:periplasmic protein TonB